MLCFRASECQPSGRETQRASRTGQTHMWARLTESSSPADELGDHAEVDGLGSGLEYSRMPTAPKRHKRCRLTEQPR